MAFMLAPATVLTALDTSPRWDSFVIVTLTILIYWILGPSVYLIMLLAGTELTWPRGTHLRPLLRRRGVASPVKAALAADPSARILRVVGGLFAVAVWASVVTLWLSNYLHDARAPQLTKASPGNLIIFLIVFWLGWLAGYTWVAGMRLASTGQACLIVIALSMSTSGSLLFFYIVEPNLRDLLLVVALGMFAGELSAVARHPMFFYEGLFSVLLAHEEPLPVVETKHEETTHEPPPNTGSPQRLGPAAAFMAARARLMGVTSGNTLAAPHPTPPAPPSSPPADESPPASSRTATPTTPLTRSDKPFS